MSTFTQVLFVCTSNTFLSPMAEAIYRQAQTEGLPAGISRGLVVLFEEPINPKCNLLMERAGIPLSGHEYTRQLCSEDMPEGGLILTMTLGEKVRLLEEFGEIKNVYTLGEFVDDPADLVSPEGESEEKFDECFARMSERITRLAEKLR